MSACLTLTSSGAGCSWEGETDESPSKRILCGVDETLKWTMFIPPIHVFHCSVIILWSTYITEKQIFIQNVIATPVQQGFISSLFLKEFKIYILKIYCNISSQE